MKPGQLSMIARIPLLLAFGMLAGAPTATAEKIVYFSQEIEDGPFELFAVEINGSGAGITAGTPDILNDTLVAEGSVEFGIPYFNVLDKVLYVATQDDKDKLEIYSVFTTNPGVSTKLNPEINKATHEIEAATPSFFSNHVLYTRRTLATDTLDLFFIDDNNPGFATQVNPPLIDGGEVGTFVVTPDGSSIIYGAQLNSEAEELFITRFDNAGIADKLDGPPPGDDAFIGNLGTSPDGESVIFIQARGIPGPDENLVIVDLDDPGNPMQVNEDLPPGGQVVDWAINPASSQIAYRMTTSSFAPGNVFLVNTNDLENATQVNPDWATGGSGFFLGNVFLLFADDGANILYTGPLDDPDAPEYYQTPVNALGTADKINAPLTDFSPQPNGVSAVALNRNETLTMYGEGPLGSTKRHVVNRAAPGTSIEPFVPGPNTQLGPLALFSYDSDLVATNAFNVDAGGMPEDTVLLVADGTLADSDIVASGAVVDGFGVLGYFWMPETVLGGGGGGGGGNGLPEAAIGEDVYTILNGGTGITGAATAQVAPEEGQHFGLLRTRPSGAIEVEVRDLTNGQPVNTVNFLGASFTAKIVTALSDSSGNGVDELAVLGVRKSNNTLVAQVRDTVTGVRITNATFLGPSFDPLDMKRVPDLNANGADELALLAINKTTGAFLVQIRDGMTGDKIRNINYLGTVYDPIDLVVIPDSDGSGSPELGVLAIHQTLNTFVVQVKNANGAFQTRNIFYLGPTFEPLAAIATPDMDNDGVPEVAVVTTKRSDGRIAVQARDAFGSPDPKTSFYLDNTFEPRGIATVSDSDSDGFPEVALLALRSSDGRFAVQTRNLTVPRRPRNAFLMDANWDPLAIVSVSDIDGNGVPDVGALGNRASDDRFRVHLRNAFGPLGNRNVFFSP